MMIMDFLKVIDAVRTFDLASEAFMDEIERTFGYVPREISDGCYEVISEVI